MNDDNNVQYLIPEDTEMKFGILSHERDLSLKLVAGTAEVYIGNRRVDLPLGQEFPLPIWECLSPLLKSRTGCDFIFRGNHYVYHATTKTGEICKNLLGVSLNGDSFVFILAKGIQLQVFVSESESEYKVSLKSIRGLSEIFGYKLLPNKKYNLPPCSSFLVNSSNSRSCSVSIQGNKRKIKVSLLDWRTRTHMQGLHDRLRALRIQAMKNKSVGPTVLVIGPENVGKTSFCHFLLNKAVDDEMNLMYIDLNVCRNANTVPGAMNLIQTEGRRYKTIGFKTSIKRTLHFGSVNFDRKNIRLYYLLIRKMGKLFASHQECNHRSYSGAVIDTCGLLGQDTSVIDCVLQSFTVDLVVVIGDKSYYEFMKHSVLKTRLSEFIPQPQNIEPRQVQREAKSRDITARKYFYGTISRPRSPNLFKVNLSEIAIYRVVTGASNCNAIDARINDVCILPVACDPSIEYSILAVSGTTRLDMYLPVSPVKYFVCFTRVDLETETGIVLSPTTDIILGGILLMGYMRMTKD